MLQGMIISIDVKYMLKLKGYTAALKIWQFHLTVLI